MNAASDLLSYRHWSYPVDVIIFVGLGKATIAFLSEYMVRLIPRIYLEH